MKMYALRNQVLFAKSLHFLHLPQSINMERVIVCAWKIIQQILIYIFSSTSFQSQVDLVFFQGGWGSWLWATLLDYLKNRWHNSILVYRGTSRPLKDCALYFDSRVSINDIPWIRNDISIFPSIPFWGQGSLALGLVASLPLGSGSSPPLTHCLHRNHLSPKFNMEGPTIAIFERRYIFQPIIFLVGGWTNPFEKYDQNGNLPQGSGWKFQK